MRLILYAILFTLSIATAQDIQATVSSNNIRLTDVFTFKIEAMNSENNPSADLAPLLEDFSIVSGPEQQTNVQWINGKMTSSRSLSWSLVAKKQGKLTIPQLDVTVGKNVVRTQLITMTVAETEQSYEAQELFLKLEVDKTQAFVGEQITATYKIYTRVNMSIQNVDFPKHSGFWTEELFVPQQVDFKDTVVEGVNYKVANLYRIALFPTKPGRLELTPMTMNVNVQIKRRSNSFFDDPFFGSFRNETVPKVLRTKQTYVTVREFPGEIPNGFTGAVGDFKLSSSVTPSKIKANNAVTFKINLKGTGNIDVFGLPEIQFPENLEVFPPTTKKEKEPFRDQISGTITKEYILIPRKTGRYVIPGITIPYFNPMVRAWRNASTNAIEIAVEPDDNFVATNNGYTKSEVELLGEDIRFIRVGNIKWNRKSNPYLLGGIYLLAAILLVLPALLFKIRDNRLSTKDFRKSKSALRTAFKKLNKSDKDHFETTASATYGYLKDKLQLSSDKLDPLKVESILNTKNVDQSITGEIIEILKVCDAGRFAPGKTETRETLVNRAKAILKKLNAVI